MAGLRVRSVGGGIQVIPARAGSANVRRLAAGLGQVGFQHRGRAGEVDAGQGLSLSGIIGAIGRGVGAIINPIGTATDLVTERLGRGSRPTLSFAPPSSCPTGFRRNAAGQCVREGFFGGVQRTIPGGATGTLSDATGEAVIGGFGLPAQVPRQVGTITRNDGTVGPILRCGSRMVLGSDNLCYPKAILGRRSRFRKHRLPTRPPVSGADMAAIRRASRTKDRVKELAQDVGWKCSTSGARKARKK